MTARDICDN